MISCWQYVELTNNNSSSSVIVFLLCIVLTPSSDSCGSQGIRTVLSPSGYIGPSYADDNSLSSGYVQGESDRGHAGLVGGGTLHRARADEDSLGADNNEPWACLLVFRLAVGQQLNVSLIDFTAVARAEFAASAFDDDHSVVTDFGKQAFGPHQNHLHQQHLGILHHSSALHEQVREQHHIQLWCDAVRMHGIDLDRRLAVWFLGKNKPP